MYYSTVPYSIVQYSTVQHSIVESIQAVPPILAPNAGSVQGQYQGMVGVGSSITISMAMDTVSMYTHYIGLLFLPSISAGD